MGLEGVKRILIVLSGKGGVGKSSSTAQLALCMQSLGLAVGVLDVDLCGPSLPRMFNIPPAQCSVQQSPSGWLPVRVGPSPAIALMSIGFLLPDPDAAVVWRGPKKTAMIGQFLSRVAWADLDLLLIDTPPGTSDEHLALVEALQGHPDCTALLVTTPQLLAMQDVEREISFCRETRLSIAGIVENMSGLVCGQCAHRSNLFSSQGGAQLAAKHGLCLLGQVPIDPIAGRFLEQAGALPANDYLSTVPSAGVFLDISRRLLARPAASSL